MINVTAAGEEFVEESTKVSKRAYSKLDVLGDYMQNPRKWKNRTMHSMRNFYKEQIRVNVPGYFHLKCDLICNRLSEKSNKVFTQNKLIDKLFEYFLETYIVEECDPHQAYKDISAIRSLPSVVKYLQLQFNSRELDLDDEDDDIDDFVPVYIKLSRYRILECESLLRDIEEYYPLHNLTVERVIQTLYCKFADDLIRGDAADVIEELYDSL